MQGWQGVNSTTTGASATVETIAPPDLLSQLNTDLATYCGVNLKIRTKKAQLVPFDLNRVQRVVHARLAQQWREEGRIRALILKARQPGVSTYVAGRFFRRVHLWGQVHALVIADKSERSAALFGISELFYEHLPADLRPRKRFSSKGKHLHLANGSKYMVETAKDTDAGRSLTIQCLHCSEFALWERAEDTLLSLIQAVPDEGSEIVIESTAQGVGNAFHRMALGAERGDNGFIFIFLPWFIHEEYQRGVTEPERAAILASSDPYERKALDEGFEWAGAKWPLSPEQLAWRRDTIKVKCGGDLRLFRQEYPTIAREAFLVSGNAFFDEDALLAYEERAQAMPPLFRGNLVAVGAGIVPKQADRGYLRLWEWPRTEQPCPVCSGVGRLPQGPNLEGQAPSLEGQAPTNGGQASSSGSNESRIMNHDSTPTAHVAGVTGDPRARCIRCKGRGTLPTRYAIGADTAEGRQVAARATEASDPEGERGGRDYNSASVWEAETERLVARLHGRMAPEVFAEELDRLGRFYSGTGGRAAVVGVERNHSSGQTVLARLRDVHRYPQLFYHRTVNQRDKKVTSVLGWVTNAETRPMMLDELSAGLRTTRLGYPDLSGIGEMWTFVRGEDGKPEAQEGCHDDRVLADAIGLQMCRYAPRASDWSEPEPEVSESPTGWS